MKSLIKISLVSYFVVVGCQSIPFRDSMTDEKLLIPDSFSFAAPENLAQKKIDEDVTTLLYALENGYGGRKYVGQAEFTSALAKLNELKSQWTITPRALCAQIDRVLLDLPDNHIAARLDGETCSDQRTYDEGKVGPNFARDRRAIRPWEITTRQIDGRTIGLIALTSFPNHEENIWDGFLETLSKIKPQMQGLIIDLRGNGGGDDTMGLEMAILLYGSESFPTPVESIVKSQTPATFALAANNLRLKILHRRVRGEPVPKYLETRLQETLELFRKAKAGSVAAEYVQPGKAGQPFDKAKGFTYPIYLLIDRACASSCESTLEVFESHPFAITVGENTGGYLHFGNMGHVALPNSKIIVQLATDFWKRRNGVFLEKVGYSPRIRVPAGQDALEHALVKMRESFKMAKPRK